MSVACGYVHTVAVTEDGMMYSWGGNIYNKNRVLCVTHTPIPSCIFPFEPFHHDNCKRITMVAAGKGHSAALAADGVVWTWGRGDQGALGYGDYLAYPKPTRLDINAFAETRAVMIACGGFHTMVVTADGRLWTFGRGKDGRLGQGDEEERLTPTLVLALEVCEAKIVMVAAGVAHSIAATSDGDVYTWGWGDDGQLGHGDGDTKIFPTKLDSVYFQGSSAVVVAAGELHSAILTAAGELFVCGNGGHGALGLGDTDNRYKPEYLSNDAFSGSLLRMAACGAQHTMAVTEKGELWTWGIGEFKQLGHGDDIQRRIPTRVDPLYFGGAKISTVAAGTHVSTALTEQGVLFTWGVARVSLHATNKPTGLGHADLEDKNVPLPMPYHYMQGARVGRFQRLPPDHASTFAELLHTSTSLVNMLDDNIVRVILDLCIIRPEGVWEGLHGAVSLLGGVSS